MEVKSASAALGALAQETRLSIFQTLIAAGSGGATPGELSGLLNVSPSTLSFHLRDLAQAGLIRAHRRGRSIVYAADYGGIRGLIEFLLADCCRGDPRLCGPYVVANVVPAAAGARR